MPPVFIYYAAELIDSSHAPRKWAESDVKGVAEMLFAVQSAGDATSSQAFKTARHVFEKPVILFLDLERHKPQGQQFIILYYSLYFAFFGF